MKLCIAVGLGNVKVGFVCRVIKTLFEFMFGVPTKVRAELGVGVGTTGTVGAGVGVVVFAAGAVDLHTDGCPVHTNPVTIWQLRHPADCELPASQDSDPTIIPSPHLGIQTP
jgi:hypothetical protein